MWLSRFIFKIYFISFFITLFAGAAWSQDNYSGQQNTNWIALENEISQLKNKIDAEKKGIDELLILKKTNSMGSSPEATENLKKKHQSFQAMSKEYNSKLKEFETKYPEKGINFGRVYKRKAILSIEQMDSTLSSELTPGMTMDSRIQKINKKIKSQLQSKEADLSKDPKSEDKKQQTESFQNPKEQTKIKSDNKKSKPDVTEKIIIVK